MPSINTPETVDFRPQSIACDNLAVEGDLAVLGEVVAKNVGIDLIPTAPLLLGARSGIAVTEMPLTFTIDVAPMYDASYLGSTVLVGVYFPLGTIGYSVELSIDGGMTWATWLSGTDDYSDEIKLFMLRFSAALMTSMAADWSGLLGPGVLSLRYTTNVGGGPFVEDGAILGNPTIAVVITDRHTLIGP